MSKKRSIIDAVVRRVAGAARHLAGCRDPEDRLIRESAEYWNSALTSELKCNAHWRESHTFRDAQLWVQLGTRHRDLLLRAAEKAGLSRMQRVLEWGCGGGMNAVVLAPDVDAYVGVDLSRETLDECARQVAATGAESFTSLLVDAAHPEVALEQIGKPCDAVLCTYVFELLPSPEYGWRIVRLAHTALRPGGVALIHIRYSTNVFNRSRLWRYAANVASNTSYSLKEFRSGVKEIGFDPLFEKIIAREPELNEQRYAYFALKRR